MPSFQLLKPVFAFSCSFASKAGAQTILTLLPCRWPGQTLSFQQGPDQVLLHPSQLRGCPKPKQSKAPGSVGTPAVTTSVTTA